MPYENQISNIGAGTEGTNTKRKKSPLANLPTYDIIFPLKHPTQFATNREADNHTSQLAFTRPSFIKKSLVKLRNWVVQARRR
jgi:hypothetical protein